MTKEHTLPSGARLTLSVSPFAESKALFQSILKEVKTVEISTKAEFLNVYKDLICVGFSSPNVEACLNRCLERCLYNGMKIANDTFEPVEARADYITVCVMVIEENIEPFLKSLYAPFQQFIATIEKAQA